MKEILYNILVFFTSPEWVEKISANFYNNFIYQDRWTWLLQGLWVTLKLTFFSFIFGLILGSLIAIIRATHDSRQKLPRYSFTQKIGNIILSVLNAVCKVYLIIIQGTPTIVQIMIIYFCIFANSRNKVAIAILGFTINSSAYIAEIIRGGLNGVPKGQMEAGRSLGFGFVSTMWYVILPQAIKIALPMLCNELITLLKETSVASMVALEDLLSKALIIRNSTYDAYMPLLAAAALYLIVVTILRTVLDKLERRLTSSEKR
ncbi:MAG: amino acid ABC transporter permease [Eubacterium sp.]|nr:amino acid ABC transporter permease [Eubacterium sp.]